MTIEYRSTPKQICLSRTIRLRAERNGTVEHVCWFLPSGQGMFLFYVLCLSEDLGFDAKFECFLR